MELLFSSISAGGLVGAANQYACLLILSIAARLKWISLSPQMDFIGSWWFMGIAGVFWLITLAPAYASLLSPGVMNTVNSISNFLSGFIVPVSSAFLALASIGVIANMNPEMQEFFETLNFFNAEGAYGATSYFAAGMGGMTGAALTGIKALAKPAISASTGTTGTVSAPLFATLENLASVVLMALAYFLSQINPWLLVVLFVIIALIFIGLLIYAIRELKKLHKGIGRVLELVQENPKIGWSIIGEFFIWGLGWLINQQWQRGILMIVFYALWWVIFLIIQPLFVGLFAFFPPLLPFAAAASIILLIMIFFFTGLNSAKALLRQYEQSEIHTELAS